MSRMANKNSAEVQGVLDKLRAIEEVYRYSSFGEVSPFVSTSEGRTLSNEILVDVVDRLFNNLPTDCLGVYKEDDGGTIQLSYTDVSMAGIGVDKSILDAALLSRILSSNVFVEIKKILDSVNYIGVHYPGITVEDVGTAKEYYSSSSDTTVYEGFPWPSYMLPNNNYLTHKTLRPRLSGRFDYKRGAMSHSIPSTWSMSEESYLSNVYAEMRSAAVNYAYGDGPYYSSHGDEVFGVPLTSGELCRFLITSPRSVNFENIVGSEMPFSYTGAELDKINGWCLNFVKFVIKI